MHGYEDDGFWSDFSETMFSEPRRAQTADVVAHSPLLGFPAGIRVLDLCCGPGLYLLPLVRRGYTVTGLSATSTTRVTTSRCCATPMNR